MIDDDIQGGMTTYCSKPASGQGKFASNFWQNVSYKTGKGKKGKKYVQRELPRSLSFCSTDLVSHFISRLPDIFCRLILFDDP